MSEIELRDARASLKLEAWLREVYPSYLAELVTFDPTLYRLDAEGRWEPDYLSYWLGNDYCLPLVGLVDGVACGFVFVGRRPFPFLSADVDAQLGELYVLPEHRAGGLGRRLVESVVRLFPGSWELSVLRRNLPALHFWRRVLSGIAPFTEEPGAGVVHFRFSNRGESELHDKEEDAMEGSILWRRLDRPGHEAARLSSQGSRWHLAGTAVFAHDRQPCRLDYHILCGPDWRTLSGKVTGWVGDRDVEVEISAEPQGIWRLNGTEAPEVAGCVDLDLNFSPSTNLLPIRRLNLAVGEEAQVRAAWLRFPSFHLEPLEQVYRRTGSGTYRYESAGGRFVRDIEVNAAGLVTLYPDFWGEEGI